MSDDDALAPGPDRRLADELRLIVGGGVARLTIVRPPLNILDGPLLAELDRRLTSLEEARFKVLLVEAEGRLFSAGVDVADHRPERIEQVLPVFHRALGRILRLPQPSVAVLQGDALGGGAELALACDLAIAADTARVGFPEIRLGAFPPVAAALLGRRIPRSKAVELITTGDLIGAPDALRLGWLTEVHSPAGLRAGVTRLLGRLTRHSRTSLSLTRAAIEAGLAEPDPVRAIARAESIYLARLAHTPDAIEGVEAFLDKRPPRWSDGA